jgi:hypothetical protein
VHLSAFFHDLIPKSILEEIWYESRGLHLIGAPIWCTFLRFQKLGGTRSESFSTRPERNITQTSHSKSDATLGNFVEAGRSG